MAVSAVIGCVLTLTLIVMVLWFNQNILYFVLEVWGAIALAIIIFVCAMTLWLSIDEIIQKLKNKRDADERLKEEIEDEERMWENER